MRVIYTIGIWFYALGVRIAALFGHAKARLMVQGWKTSGSVEWRRPGHEADGVPTAWFHAASLGEFEQARPLIERLKAQHPQQKIVVTFFSPSGYELRKDYALADGVYYLPFATRRNAKRFLNALQPCMAFFIKYEFWKNYLTQLHRHHVPTYSVASIFRPNQIFFRSYGKNYARVLQCFTHFFVQNETSRQLLAQCGLDNVTIVGDTRFDRVIQICQQAKTVPMAEAFAQTRPQGSEILVAGSTWPADEDILIPYFNCLSKCGQ